MSFLIVIFSLIILFQMSTDLYLSSLPQIGQYFHSTDIVIQLSVTSFVIGMTLSHILFSPLSDKYGRRAPLLTAVLISIFGTLVCIMSSSITIFIIGRLLQGIGVGCCNSVGRCCVQDKYNGNQLAKVSAMIGILSIGVMIVSPTLGGYLTAYFGWLTNFYLLLLIGLSVWALMLIFLPDTNDNKDTQALTLNHIKSNLSKLIADKTFIRYTLTSSLASAGIVSWYTVSSFLLSHKFNLSPSMIGLQNLYIAAAILISGLIVLTCLNSIGIKRMVLLGAYWMALAGFSLIIIVYFGLITLPILMISMMLFSAGCGLVFINAFAGAFHSTLKTAGLAAMIYALLQDALSSVGSFIIAIEHNNIMLTLAIILCTTGLLSFKLIAKTADIA